MNDRERAINALRRGVPLGQIVVCSCFTEPPKRKGCVGVCGDTVDAVVASYADLRREIDVWKDRYESERRDHEATIKLADTR